MLGGWTTTVQSRDCGSVNLGAGPGGRSQVESMAAAHSYTTDVSSVNRRVRL